MKKTFKFLLGAMALGLVACSSDEPVADQTGSNSTRGDFFATLTLDFGGTRSSSTNDGGAKKDPDQETTDVEVGTDSENNVGQVLVVLASNEGKYITASIADASYMGNDGEEKNVTHKNNIRYSLQFETQTLYASAEKTVNVYAYCNPTPQIRNMFLNADNSPKSEVEAGFIDKVLDLEGNPIWESNRFLMTNAFLCSVTLPSQDEMYKTYNKVNNPFKLGTVVVQRAAARFDFKSTNNNTYTIKHRVTGKEIATITFTGMALFNQAKRFYAFKHVSSDGTSKEWQHCDLETSTNYVVGPFWEAMRGYVNSLDFATENYNFPFYDKENKVTRNAESYQYSGIPSGNSYSYWTYTTPNTIPSAAQGDKNSLQVKAFTSGIIFKAEINAKEKDTELAKAMEAGEDIYVFNGELYSMQDMVDYITKYPNSLLADAFNKTFEPSKETGTPKKYVTKDGVKESSNGFAVYHAKDNKYYCYYYYYNRHNDNGVNTQMGQMEFAVVRNNVYKLSVSTVLSYGHPADPGDDPDPEDPDDPDETPETYFSVNVEVLPWVVRYNNIEF